MTDESWQRHRDQQQAETRARLDRCRTEGLASGKEPFDEQKFKSLYSAPWGDYDDLETLEYYYYAVHTTVRTIAEYAENCRIRDLYDGGDMHLDP